MNQNVDIDQFRRLMGEAACLPEDDPQRQQIVREVIARGPEAEQEWLTLLSDDERLRLALRRVVPATGLEQRLLAIPDQTPPALSGWRQGFGLWALGLAAVLMLGLTLWLVVTTGTNRNAGSYPPTVLSDAVGAKQRLITLAAQLHEQSPKLALETSQPAYIEAKYAGYLPEPVQVPRLGDEYVLVGAMATTLNGGRVVVTRWRHQGQDCSLYQFCPAEFDLPMDLPTEELVTSLDPQGDNRYRIKLWSEDHCAYALVGRCDESTNPVMQAPEPI